MDIVAIEGGDISRRSFCYGALATAISGFCSSVSSRLRIGVLSDLHLTANPDSATTFERALRYFDSRHVDGVLVCGDLTDTGLPEELALVAQTWFKVFPDGRRSDGEAVAQLFHLGDHDMGGYMQRRLKGGQRGELDGRVLPNVDTAAVWERLFRESWAPIQVKCVKGYEFLLAHHPKHTRESMMGDAIPGLEDALSKVGRDPLKPFFYSQHRIIRNTVCRQYAWGMDSGKTTDLLLKRPNCIAFCGHGHVTATDDENLWQVGFTAIEVPSLKYCLTRPGHENGYNIGDRPESRHPPSQMRSLDTSQARQGLVVELGEGLLTIERRDFVHGFEELGKPWKVPVWGTRLTDRERMAAAPVPQFPAGAVATVTLRQGKDSTGIKTDQVVVGFPSAKGAYDYLVGNKRVFSPTGLFASDVDVGPVRCVFSAEEFAALSESDRRIWPANSWGVCGHAIAISSKIVL